MVVVVVVVRELFSLVTSSICVRVRDNRSEVTKLLTTWLKFFVYYCIFTTVEPIVGTISTLFCCVNIKLMHFFVD